MRSWSVRDRGKWEGEAYLPNTSPRCFAKCWKRFSVHSNWLTLCHKHRWRHEFSTSSGQEPMAGKGSRSLLLPKGELFSNICCILAVRLIREESAIPFKAELNKAFKSVSYYPIITVGYFIFGCFLESLRVNKGNWKFCKSLKIWLLYVFN